MLFTGRSPIANFENNKRVMKDINELILEEDEEEK